MYILYQMWKCNKIDKLIQRAVTDRWAHSTASKMKFPADSSQYRGVKPAMLYNLFSGFMNRSLKLELELELSHYTSTIYRLTWRVTSFLFTFYMILFYFILFTFFLYGHQDLTFYFKTCYIWTYHICIK